MRLSVVAGCLCALIASTIVVIALVSPRMTSTVAAVHDIAKPAADEGYPPISPTGPHPKAVVDETDYDFGRMEVGEEQSHVFTIRNEGEAPLIIFKGPTTCQCTISDVESGAKAPGESAQVTLTWKPTIEAEQFSKGAEIRTNDPQNKKINFRILGIVASRLVILPSINWEAPDVQEGSLTQISGAVLSRVIDEFEILGIASKSPLVSAEAFPLAPEKLETQKGLCGYEIRVSIKPDMPVGGFKFPLTIKTDIPQRDSQGEPNQTMEVDVLVSGHRRGPIKVIGKEWIEEKMAIAMGTFESSAGKKVILPLFVRGASEELLLTEPPQCEPADLKVTLERDEKSKGTHVHYFLGVEYPAGAPRAHFSQESPAKIKLRMNLPGAEEIDLAVYLNAY
jgi:hypothetical protein